MLVNDFGPVDVDAGLLADSAGQVLRLANGCVCCSLAGGLDEALARVLALDPLPEWIVIEASGVSDPARIAQVGLADPMLQLEGVAVLVDAAAIREAAADPLLADTVARQLRAADLLVLNKTDLVSAQALDALRHWLHGQNGGTAMVEAREGRVGLECLEGDWDANACGCGACDTKHGHAHAPQEDPAHPFDTCLARAAAAGRAPFRGSDEAPAPAADARQGLGAHGPAWLGADAMGGPAAAFRRAGAASGRCRRARTGADRDARSGWLGRDRGLPGRGGPRLNAACLRRVRRFGLPARLVQAIPRLVLVHPTAAAYLDPDDGACRAGLGGAPFRDYRPTEESRQWGPPWTRASAWTCWPNSRPHGTGTTSMR